MQTTTTKTARKIVRNILKREGVRVSTQTYTNMCADDSKRNLCWIVQGLTDEIVEHIALNLNVTDVRKTDCKKQCGAQMQYLRVVHCAN